MNLRISTGQLRFRITREELVELSQGNTVRLSGVAQNYSIQAGEIKTPLSLIADAGKIMLTVNKSTLDTFAKQLPSREGIEYMQRIDAKDFLLALEVDVRKSPK